MRFTAAQYDQAIAALRDAREQLVPDGYCCRICHDTGHMAWECGHNPLLAVAMCEGIAKQSSELHDRLHVLEEAMDDADQTSARVNWRDDAHEYLHHLAGHNTWMGSQMGPARVQMPDEATP